MADVRLQVLQIYRLLQFVHKNDKEQIEKMVNLGVENLINLTEPQDGIGVLHVAVAASNQDLVSFLLSLGAKPDVQDRRGRTPVMLAAELGDFGVMELLVHHQADMRLQDVDGKGVLFYGMHPSACHTHCLQVALTCDADVNNVSLRGAHVFQLLCEQAQVFTPVCLIMLEQGADPNATDQETGMTALMAAAQSGSLELVREILRKGGSPNALDQKRRTAVHFAAMGAFLEVIQVLSAFSADMGVSNLEDRTPLHYAAATGDANCCRFLAQRGCNPKLKNLDGLLPRQIAKEGGFKAAMKDLKKAEKQHAKRGKMGDEVPTFKLWALALHDWSNENEAELRHAFGADSEKVPADVFTSVLERLKAPVELEHIQIVIQAHQKGREACVNSTEFFKGLKYVKKPFLLSSFLPKKKKEKGKKGGKKKGKFAIPLPICTLPPELNPRRADGGPPNYMIEAYRDFTDAARFDPDHPPKHPIMNDSVWYMERPDRIYVNINDCVKTGDLESLDLAFSQGVAVDVQDQFYKTPLMVACSSGNCQLTQYLLQKGANVNTSDQFLWSPLHHAASAGQVDIIQILLKAGAAMEARTLCGGTPLMRAIQSSRPSCVDFLINAGANVIAENKKEQNCLDIAVAYGDPTIINLVKTKVDTLPKPKDTGKDKKNPKSKGKGAK